MMEEWKDKIKKYGAIYSAFLTFLCMIIILGMVQALPGQKQTIFRSDLYAQVVPFARTYANMLKSGENFYYSRYLGMGSATIMVYAFYAMSPVNLIYLLIPEDLLAAVVVTIMKPVLAAVFFWVYSKKELKSEDGLAVLFSVCYGLCGYGFGVMSMPPIMDCIYYLPLIFTLVGRFIRKKKGGLLALSYASLFITHFYAGFLVGLASFGYLCFLLFLNKKEKKETLLILLHYAIAVVCAFLTAGFLLLPLAYFVATRGGTMESVNLSFANFFEVLSGFMVGKTYEYNTEYAYMFCGILPLVLAPLYFLNSNVSKKQRFFSLAVLGLLSIAFWVKPIYVFLHMGNDPEGYCARYTFLISFILLSVSLRQWKFMKENREQISEKVILIISGVWGALFMIIGINELVNAPKKYSIITFTCLNIALVLIWGVGLKIWCEKKQRVFNVLSIVSVVLICVECCVNSISIMQSIECLGSEEYFVATGKYRQAVAKIQADNPEHYRIGSDSILTLNQGLLYEYGGIGFMWAAYQPNLVNTMHNLGYLVTNHRVSDEGSSGFTRMILGQKYDIDLVKGEDAGIETRQALPLGYMVYDLPKTEEFVQEDFFYNAELLAQKMVNKEYVGIFENADQYGIHPNGITLESDGKEGFLLKKMQGTESQYSYVKLSVPAIEDKIVYGVFAGDSTGAGAKVFSMKNTLAYQFYRNYDLRTARLVELDSYGMDDTIQNNDENAAYISLGPGVLQTDLSEVRFAYMNNAALDETYKELSKNVLHLTKFEDGVIDGTVSSTLEKQLLFVSVPYEEGWKAYVDGNETEIRPVLGDAFIGIKLGPGEHEVSLRYEQPLAKEGCFTSLLGILMLVGLFVKDCVRNKNEMKEIGD